MTTNNEQNNSNTTNNLVVEKETPIYNIRKLESVKPNLDRFKQQPVRNVNPIVK